MAEQKKTESGMPTKITIRGGMVDSALKANGWTFDAEGLATLAASSPEAPFVVDHDSGISSVAGQVTAISAVRLKRTREVNDTSTDDPKGERKRVKKTFNDTVLSKEAVLTPENPAFEAAAKSIIATRAAGKTPQTSFSIQIDGISFDRERDAIRLEPPYRFVHDALVSRGAMGPEDGVGAIETDIKFSPDDGVALSVASLDVDGAEAIVACRNGMHIAGLESHVAAFAAHFSSNPDAMKALARTGVVATQAAPDGALGAIVEDSNTQTALKEPGEPETMADEPNKNAPPAAKSQDPGDGVPSGGHEDASVLKAVETLSGKFQTSMENIDKRISAIEDERKAVDEKKFTKAKDDAIALGLDETIVDECATVAEVERLVRVHGASGSTTTRGKGKEGGSKADAEPYDSWAAHYAEAKA